MATGRALGTVYPASMPSSTPAPTATPAPPSNPTVTPALERTPQVDFWATESARLTADYPVQCGEIRDIYSLLKSPGGNWLAVMCGSKARDLIVTHRDGRQWTLPFGDDYKGGQAPYAGSMGGVYPLYWSADETYLYFAPRSHVSGGGPCWYGMWYHALYRIDVNTGSIAVVLPLASADWVTYEIAFSPQGEKLAYDAGTPTIFDLQTGSYFPVGGGQGNSGGLVWSPDGTKLAYATCKVTEDWEGVAESSIQIYSLHTGVSETVHQAEGRWLYSMTSADKARLEILDCRPETSDCRTLQYGWQTGQLHTQTPEPTPTPAP